ncbi:MAG: hypothetical protein ACE5I7_09095 [Candidatus Binatia bacterium]
MKNMVVAAVAVAAAAALLAASAVQAGPIKRREVRQRVRIHQGMRSGELTPGEANALRHEQHAIEHARHRALADGQVSPRERRRLEHAQHRASRDIYRLKHNNRTRPHGQ